LCVCVWVCRSVDLSLTSTVLDKTWTPREHVNEHRVRVRAKVRLGLRLGLMLGLGLTALEKCHVARFFTYKGSMYDEPSYDGPRAERRSARTGDGLPKRTKQFSLGIHTP